MQLEQKSVKNLVGFLGDLNTPKSHSEINWPLVCRQVSTIYISRHHSPLKHNTLGIMALERYLVKSEESRIIIKILCITVTTLLLYGNALNSPFLALLLCLSWKQKKQNLSFFQVKPDYKANFCDHFY